VEVTIDGKKVSLEGPVTVLEAARRAGVDIPTLCWHPRVSVLGACRLCMIEVEGINRLLAACTTQVSDGMTVLTDTPQLRKVRQTMLELLLCRHPLDCPTCVKGGECELQELTYRHSAPENRFPENPAPYAVADPSPFVERDSEKCVLCRRCVRVCREVRGVTVLGAMERGYHKRVGTFFQQPLNSDFQEPYNCEFCGSCIDICPVGALNSKVRKFRGRTWEGTTTDSVCPFCSVGCLLSLQVKEGELVRTVPREGPNNEDQACFRGRFGTDYVNSTSRIITPLLGRNGRQTPVDVDEAVRFAVENINGARRAEMIVSSGLTGEEIEAAGEFAGAVLPGGTLRAVDTLGLDELAGASRPWEDLEKADLIVVAGQDFTVFEPVAGVRIRVARGKTGAGLIVLDPRDALLGGEADLWLRPPGEGLALLLAGLLRTLAASHGDRLRAAGDKGLLASLPGAANREVEEQLGLPGGSVEELARRIAAGERVVFVGHRGWYDPEGSVPSLLKELDRLLSGEGAGMPLFLGRDCNSRGAAEVAAAGRPTAEGAPDLVLLAGADPLGTALPGSPLAKRINEAETVIVFDTFPTETARAADVLFPLPTFAEKEGRFTSSSGLSQQLRRAISPPPGVVSLRETLEGLASSLGKSLPQGSVPKGSPPAAASPAASGGTLPSAGERFLVLRGIPIADHRIRLVGESAPLFPGPVAEVHPVDLAALGLESGDSVKVLSGGGELVRQVKADLKTPPGMVHLPCDPADAGMAAFVGKAERPEGWPATLRKLAGLERVAAEGKEQ
jgi:NADH dehydrogenase/NADH:ubiquinone oxidoreductase subunit G